MNRMLCYVMNMSCDWFSKQSFFTLTHATLDPRAMATQASRVTLQEAELLGHLATLVCHVSAAGVSVAHLCVLCGLLCPLPARNQSDPPLCVYRSSKSPELRGSFQNQSQEPSTGLSGAA